MTTDTIRHNIQVIDEELAFAVDKLKQAEKGIHKADVAYAFSSDELQDHTWEVDAETLRSMLEKMDKLHKCAKVIGGIRKKYNLTRTFVKTEKALQEGRRSDANWVHRLEATAESIEGAYDHINEALQAIDQILYDIEEFQFERPDKTLAFKELMGKLEALDKVLRSVLKGYDLLGMADELTYFVGYLNLQRERAYRRY